MIIDINEFIKINLHDEVFGVETDTVYGLGCLLKSKEAVKRIYKIKGREFNKPLAVLCGNLDQVKELVSNFNEGEELAKKYWPGALTLIFDKKDDSLNYITSGFSTIGIRIPNNEKIRKIINTFGPIVMTSLNKSHEKEILKFEDALEFNEELDYLIIGKDLDNIPSTVYDVKNKKTLRNGKICIK